MKTLLVLGLLTTSALAAVQSVDVTLRDEKRGQDIACRVYAPDSGDNLPLIIFSHGFGADKTAFAAISQHVAAHGYVVVHPSHADGFGKSKDRSTPEEDSRGWGALRNGGGLAGLISQPGRIEGRIADVVAVMDSLEQLTTQVPGLKGRLDATRIGVGGHSFGAYTAISECVASLNGLSHFGATGIIPIRSNNLNSYKNYSITLGTTTRLLAERGASGR
ncbi:MAG: hypothetical protein Fur0032_00790 [Terrimicrobiaceae bacterium]